MAVRMFAAIDVGSFALELGIYEISDKTGIRNVEHIRHVIALGSDTFSEGKISYDLVDEMCRVLEKFTETMKMYRVKDYRAYATTAMREAKNSRIILDQIRVRTGLSALESRYGSSATRSSALSATRPLPPKAVSLTRSSRRVQPSWM